MTIVGNRNLPLKEIRIYEAGWEAVETALNIEIKTAMEYRNKDSNGEWL